MAEAKKRRRFRWLRRTAAGLAILLVAAVIVVAFAGPSIVAALVPAITSRLGLPGRVEVQDVALSWRGDLQIGRAAIFDPQGAHVATLSVRTGGGLLGLLDAYIEQDIHIDGWATVQMDADGTTNIERALGLQRGGEPEPAADTDAKAEMGQLPFSRVILEGLDLSITREGSPTLALAGLKGEVQAEADSITAIATADLGMPPSHPTQRQEIAQAPQHGSLDISADLALATLTGSAKANITGLTEQAARALGGLSGDDTIESAAAVAARGGLTLNVDAQLANAIPTNATVKANSRTLTADLAIGNENSAITLDRAGALEIDTAAFLADDTIRTLVLPGEGVSVTQAGRLTLSLDRFNLPMPGGKPALDQAEAAATVRAGRTLMNVPGPDGQPFEVRISELTLHAALDHAKPLTVTALARAGVKGQPDGSIDLNASADLDRVMGLTDQGAQISPAMLTSITPNATLKLDAVPVMAAKPWLGALEAMGLDVPRIVGPSITATIAWSAAENDAANLDLDISAAHVQASARAQWTSDAVALLSPATFNIARPNAIALPWLPQGWALENGQGVSAEVSQLRLPMHGLKPELARAQAAATVRAGGARLHAPDLPALGVNTLTLNLSTGENATTIQLASTPTVANRPTQLSANLRAGGIGTLLASQGVPTVTGTVEASAPADVASAFDMQPAGMPLQQWVSSALGPQVTAKLELLEPQDQSLLAGVLNVNAQHASLEATGISLATDRLDLGGATLNATPRRPLWNALAPRLGLEGATLATTAPIVVQVGSASIPLGQGAPLAAGLDGTTVTLATQGNIRLDNVPVGQPTETGERPRTSVALTTLKADINSLGRAIAAGPGLDANLGVIAESPGQGRIAEVQARATSGQNGELNANVVIDKLNTPLATALAGLAESATTAIRGALGDTARVELTASARSAPQTQQPWTLTNASIALTSPRLTTASPITAAFSPDAITLARPTQLTWKPDAQWLQSAIGAQIDSVEPFQINLERIELGNPLVAGSQLLNPETVFIDATVSGTGATIAIPDRPNIEFDTLDARVRRVGLSTYSLTANAATTGGGKLELNSLIEKPTDIQGRLDLQTAVLRGTLKGDDVPVAIADAMSNTDGLLADSLGPQVDLDAEISNARLIPGQPPAADLRFSVRGPRADASGYGRLENHIISMPEPQTILTVREVRPEIAERFSELIPELLQVEKRPEDGPAVIRTQGLQIPTNGDWAKGQGTATIALGTARFRTSSLLAGVLKATGQRREGQVGRRIDPIEVSMINGLITYTPFKLPLGDLTIESEGTVNLAANEMNVLVWLPMAALSDEAAGRFNTGLGSLVGRSVPGFGTATTVPWRVSGPLDSPSIRPAPQVLIQRRGDELFGPLLRPGQTVQDLLSIPRQRQEQPQGGG